MAELYEENFKVSKYVHVPPVVVMVIQTAVGMLPQDYMFPYYQDDSMLLAIGMKPYDLILQLLAKETDHWWSYLLCPPSLNDIDKPKIPHQSSATGMRAIPQLGGDGNVLAKAGISLTEFTRQALADNKRYLWWFYI
jgi:2-oxoisovalerate dehydrogenase E1 component